LVGIERIYNSLVNKEGREILFDKLI
jgi:hypothetical protein